MPAAPARLLQSPPVSPCACHPFPGCPLPMSRPCPEADANKVDGSGCPRIQSLIYYLRQTDTPVRRCLRRVMELPWWETFAGADVPPCPMRLREVATGATSTLPQTPSAGAQHAPYNYAVPLKNERLTLYQGVVLNSRARAAGHLAVPQTRGFRPRVAEISFLTDNARACRNAPQSAISFTPGFTRSDAALGNPAVRSAAPAKWQRGREAAAHVPSSRALFLGVMQSEYIAQSAPLAAGLWQSSLVRSLLRPSAEASLSSPNSPKPFKSYCSISFTWGFLAVTSSYERTLLLGPRVTSSAKVQALIPDLPSLFAPLWPLIFWDFFGRFERRLQLASAMLDRLFTDLVLYVLALTDVYTILSLSRVNKFFHSITLAKHLWIPIVRDLVMRGLSDFPPDEDLRVYSAEALVEEVKRAVAGPHTWSPQFESGPTIYREVKLEYAVPGGDGLRSTQWLPGGRHVLFEYSVLVGNIRTTWLRCWEIIAAQCREVWDITCVGILVAAAFDFRTGSKLIVSLVLNDAHGFSFILLLEVDLSTGVSSSLFQLGPTIVWPWRVRISDDYMAWQGASGDSIIVLINWLSGEFIAFESTERRASFELFPGHILLAYPTSRASTPCSVHLYSIASLDHLWRPVSEFNFHDHNIRSSLKGVPSVVLNVLGNNKTSPCTISVEVIGCPVHSETYDLVVVVQNPVYQSSSSRLASAWRRLRSRDDARNRPTNWNKTISRYHFGLSSGTDSSSLIPQPTLVSILRHSTNCPFALDNPYWATPLWNSYTVCWNGHRRHRGHGGDEDCYPECHSGRVDVQRLHEAGTSSVVTLSVPDLDGANDVKVSNTGAIMMRLAAISVRDHTSKLDAGKTIGLDKKRHGVKPGICCTKPAHGFTPCLTSALLGI
ncbi:hypothetical protein GGX14DRAFT_401394 [Mycena pura]|uniref:F-box domain-containing protein n=1 Tax=Mycena pura TaxID=153505 RepID=A0AAD6Y4W1_9AGAR|nr:hypothetical protein GGX14DRAFT_401394 [Mycena pura]